MPWTANELAVITAYKSVIGRRGGNSRSAKKTAAVRKNGLKGGRPRKLEAVAH